MSEYIPSPRDWVREQVELYESSSGTEGTTLREKLASETKNKIDTLVSQKALEDKKIKPALQPKIEVTSFDEDKDLVYTMAVETLPEIEVKDYKGFKLTKYVAKADDAAIDDALKRIASMRKTSELSTCGSTYM